MPESRRHQRVPLLLQLVLKLGRASYVYERYLRTSQLCQNVAFSIFFLKQNVFKEILNSSNTNAVMFNMALRV